MKHRLCYSAQSRADLDDIWEHAAEEFCDTAAAQRIVDKILNAVDRLETFPDMGAPLSSVADVNGDYRFLVCGSYLVFYRAEKDDVYIDRVLYGRRDYLRILFKERLTGADNIN